MFLLGLGKATDADTAEDADGRVGGDCGDVAAICSTCMLSDEPCRPCKEEGNEGLAPDRRSVADPMLSRRFAWLRFVAVQC